jgi:hypothetical protein
MPEPQATLPSSHWLFPGLHEAFCVHALHVPLSQTPFAPPASHPAPGGAFFGITHVCAPVAHDVCPVTHRSPLGMLQASPEVQGTHAPLPLQTWPEPQGVPGPAGLPVSVHVLPPPEHVSVPLSHALPVGTHGLPFAHAAQSPLLSQYEPGAPPQGVPGAALPIDVHTGAPVVQTTEESLHEPGVLQSMPAVQATQPPLPLQTSSLPQGVPGATSESVQVGGPFVPQAVDPVTHAASAGLHARPGVHAASTGSTTSPRPASCGVGAASGEASVEVSGPNVPSGASGPIVWSIPAEASTSGAVPSGKPTTSASGSPDVNSSPQAQKERHVKTPSPAPNQLRRIAKASRKGPSR